MKKMYSAPIAELIEAEMDDLLAAVTVRMSLLTILTSQVQEWQKVKVEWNMKVASLMNNLFH